MVDYDPRQAPPPSAPPPTIGQQPVSVNGQIVINNGQRGSLSNGYNAYAQQGYSEYMQQVSRHFGEIARYTPDRIAQTAEKIDLTPNRGVAFLQEGQFVAQYSMINGRYAVGKVYDLSDSRPNGGQAQLDQVKTRLLDQQRNIDPISAAGIQARHEFENLAYGDPNLLARQSHVYPNANGFGNGEAYLVRGQYAAKYGFVDGRFEMQQVFDLRNPVDGAAFSGMENNASNRERNVDSSVPRGGGPYGAIPVPYPVGHGGTNVGVVVNADPGGGVRVGGQVDVRVPGIGRIDVGGIFKPK